MSDERLSDNFFLIVHDEFTGKLRVSHDLLECGLVVAQVAELISVGRLGMVGDRVLVRDPGSGAAAGVDEISAFVVDSVGRQSRPHSVRTWIETLGSPLFELVARRLMDRGVLRRESGRGLLMRRPDRFPAVNLLAAARPQIRLEHMLTTPTEFDLAGAVTASVINVLGIGNVLDPTLDRAATKAVIDRLHGHLPSQLRMLLKGAEAAVAAVSLTVRR
ncbi:MAG: GPP34 family phosphoprotein [Pseudonocardia sp.]|nr:GPP34 family phosphoprotein [Pseudonocardia sp.]